MGKVAATRSYLKLSRIKKLQLRPFQETDPPHCHDLCPSDSRLIFEPYAKLRINQNRQQISVYLTNMFIYLFVCMFIYLLFCFIFFFFFSLKSKYEVRPSMASYLLSFRMTCATEVMRVGWSGKAHGTGHLGQVF